MNITKEKLLAKGYKEFPCKGYKGEFCTGGFQRIVTLSKIKLYFINVYLWSFPDHDSASVEVRLYRGTKGVSHWEQPGNSTKFEAYEQFDVNYLTEKDTTIEAVEAFYREVFERLDCCPDQHNND